jgi:hypothetical protein
VAGLQRVGVAQLPPPAALLPFEIMRRPRRIATKAMTLPTNTAVDLFWSGLDHNGDDEELWRFRSLLSPSAGKQPEVVVMFDGKGRVSRAFPAGIAANPTDVVGNAYLLVGRIDQVPLVSSSGQAVTPAAGLFNLTDLSTLWVAVTQRGWLGCPPQLGAASAWSRS